MQKVSVFFPHLFLWVFCYQSFAQKNFTFGKVSSDELKMTVYEKDSAAGAIILCDIGKFDGDDLTFTRHIRIKILRKSGLDWGNWVFNTPTKGQFKVTVFNLENSEIVKDKADKSSIYEEEILEDLKVYKVFAPKVKVGSVIDITYSFIGIPFEWRFQERIPVVYNQITLEDSPYIEYSKTTMGLAPINTISSNSWGIEHMPAFEIEPFTNYYGNYLSKFVFQINAFRPPQIKFYKDISTSWKNVIENLLNSPSFGGVLNSGSYLNGFAKSVRTDNIGIQKKIDTCYRYIQSNLKWNGSKSLFVTNQLKSNFMTTHSGNSAEINLSLVALLNKVGVTAYPIALSTRDNGLLLPHFPSFDRLNYVICYVQHKGLELFIDATSEFCVPGILPMHCLNGDGLLVKLDNEQWFSLYKKEDADIRKQFISVKIKQDGTANATITQSFNGQGFLDWAQELNQTNGKEIRMNKLQSDFRDVKILSYEVNKSDKVNSTSTETIEIDLANHLIDAGDEFLLNPHIMFEYTKNPFKNEVRKCPVDMGCKKESSVTILVQLPKGLKPLGVQRSVSLQTPDKSASFTYHANSNGNALQFRLVLKINKHVFTESEYDELREFFSEVIKITNSQIQLEKV
jgi:hypothetical protein